MHQEEAAIFTLQLASDGPVKQGPGGKHPVPKNVAERFGVRSQIGMALYPKGSEPWLFGMHQCAYARDWTDGEAQLFNEIGRRLTDGLTTLMSHRNLQQSEEKYRRIVETASEGICVLDSDGKISFLNPRMARMLGYSIDDMIGRPVSDYLFAEDIADHARKMKNRKIGLPETYERRFLRKDGRVVWTIASATPIFDRDHQFQGSFAMFTDITERKRVETDLIRAKEEAEKAARLRSQFLNIAAHELRSPMTTLSIALDLAHKQKLKGQPLDIAKVERLKKQASRLDRLVSELLDVSRLERGTLKLHRTHFNIVSLIAASVEEFHILAPNREIRFKIPEQDIDVTADPVRIHQVLSNLLDNAIKYTPGETPIEVQIASLPHSVRISVVDFGPGIPFEEQEDLLKPFTRGAGETVERVSGLGLGLFVCHEITRLHGGVLGFESKPGEGSTFYFELPTHELRL